MSAGAAGAGGFGAGSAGGFGGGSAGSAGGLGAGSAGPAGGLGAGASPAGALAAGAGSPAGGGLEYSVVVPVFNEEKNVRPLVERVAAAMRKVGDPFEIVFVDDGSRDATPALLRAAVAEYPFVRAVRFARNFGQEAAVQAGYAHARGRWIIQMDGDLQNPPEDIPKLLALKGDAFDIVYGVRKNRQDPLFRRAASLSMRYVMRRMLDIELPDDISTFRLMRASTAKLLADLPERNKFLSALACWVGARYTSVDVGHAARAAGRTKYNFGKLLNHTFDLVVGFSSKPLRYVGMLGLACALVGFLAGARAVAYKLFWGTAVTGWASLFAAVSVLGGMQLVALSLIGEYVARIYVQAQARPLYLVAEVLGSAEPAALAAASGALAPAGATAAAPA
ncbi:MAG TPA: glycosyltransferase family 2 protein, partial [Polyangiaceae bacterium]|nr:glycosyltransferase family 2 protein [Polyangiaceae bacterium]